MPGKHDKRRLFFAVYPQASVRQQLAAMAEQLGQRFGGRPITADNIHLTLAFLGNVDDSTCQCARAVADTIHGQPFDLVIDCLGYWHRPRIVWAGCSQTPAALLDLVSRLRAGLEGQCDIASDRRPYQVHLTLLRKVAGARLQNNLSAPVNFAVSNMVLMESVSVEGGVRYVSLHNWSLQEGPGV